MIQFYYIIFFKWVETTNQHGSFTNLHSLQLTVGTCQETTPKANQPSIYLEFSGAMLVSGMVNPMFVEDETPYAHMSVSENSGFYPHIIHVDRVFHYFHHPFSGPTPIFGKHPYDLPLICDCVLLTVASNNSSPSTGSTRKEQGMVTSNEAFMLKLVYSGQAR